MSLFSSLKDLFAGKKGKTEQMSLLGPEQQQSLQNLLQASQGAGAGGAFGDAADYYRDLLSPDSQTAQQMFAPEMQKYQQETIPDLAEQFAGGGSGALSSSGFRNSAVRAGSDLAERLAAMRAGLRQQGAQGLMGLGQQAVSPQYYQTLYKPRTPGLLENAASGLGGAIANLPLMNFGKSSSVKPTNAPTTS